MGAWTFVRRKSRRCSPASSIKQSAAALCRPAAAASPATGLLRRHNREQAQLVDEALTRAKH